MTVKELFDFVTDPTVHETNIDEYLDRAMEIASTRTFDNDEKVNEEVGFRFFFSFSFSTIQVLNLLCIMIRCLSIRTYHSRWTKWLISSAIFDVPNKAIL
jgi:hypothetical protein